MAIAFVNDFVGSQDFVATTDINPDATVTAGNLAVIIVCGNADGASLSSVSDSKNGAWSVVSGAGGALTGLGMCLGVAYKSIGTNILTTDTITPTIASADGLTAVVAEFSGVATSLLLDQSTSQISAFGQSHSSGLTGNTTQADELLIGAHLVPDSGGAWTATGSFAVTPTGDYNPFTLGRLVLQYRIVAASTTYESTGTTANDAGTRSGIATFKGAAAAASQILRPDADTTTTGWTTTPLWSKIEESVADGTIITATAS